MDEREKLQYILEEQSIYTVYQPIVSLEDGTVYGYEALSRIRDERLKMDIELMFATADQINKAWELEALCRSRALEGFAPIAENKKLFLNVNPNIIHDEKFKEGFTKKQIQELQIPSKNITFEITERVSVMDRSLFQEAIDHYRNQDYGIAIDDVGSGFSGLNVIVDVKPKFMKLDMHLIRKIDQVKIKLQLCRALADFCRNSGIKLIAEGIENEEELVELIKLGVDYGQGYFLAEPEPEFREVTPDKVKVIQHHFIQNWLEQTRESIYPIVRKLCRPGCLFRPDDKAEAIYTVLEQNQDIMEFTIVEDGLVYGFMTRSELNEMLGGRFGYSLNSKKTIRQLIHSDFLKVSSYMTADKVSWLAMQRPYKQLYQPVVVEHNNRYLGIVTVKDLLETCSKAAIDHTVSKLTDERTAC